MSYGLMVIAINLGYLVFAIVAGFFLAKFLKRFSFFDSVPRVLLSILLILGIALAPFYDLLIQKGIKCYYQFFDKTYAKIYAYPEKDSEGRVESLADNKEFHELSAYFIDTSEDRIKLKNRYSWIRDFTENYIRGSFDDNTTKDFGYIRIYLNKHPIGYEKIENPKDFKARYQVLTKVIQHGFYKEMKTSFWDKRKNKLLAETLEIVFPVKKKKNKFRYKYLHQHGANGGGGIFIDDIYGSAKEVYRKLFSENKKKEGNLK